MTDSKHIKSGMNVVYLAACALNDTCPDKDTVQKMELADVYEQASRHSMNAITYIALSAYIKQYGADGLDGDTLKKWQQSYNIALRKLVFMAIERESLLAFLESKGIWYMPLKGVILLDYYRKLGMRQMSDNDILVDPKRREEIRSFMLESGYEIIHYGCEHPDTYIKDGKFCFEIHHALYFDVDERKLLYEYYRDVKDKLVGDGKSEFGYRFRDEDFYIYLITHAHKHFASYGNGIRALVDMYVLKRQFADNLDAEYVKGELEKLGIADYEQKMSVLSEKLFCEKVLPDEYETVLDEQEMQMLCYHIDSGVFGTPDTLVSNAIKEIGKDGKITRGAKLKYLLSRIFPDMDFYKINYPKAYKHRILLPFYWFLRLFRCVIHFKKSTRELKAVIDTERSDK